MKLDTLDVEISVMQFFGVDKYLVVPNVSFGVRIGGRPLHECDLLVLSKSNYASEIEIKISKADLLRDRKKKHSHYHDAIKHLWFAVPKNLTSLAVNEIPSRSGLLEVGYDENYKRNYVDVVRKPKANKSAIKWTDEDRLNLARLGCMRILKLKKKIKRAGKGEK